MDADGETAVGKISTDVRAHPLGTRKEKSMQHMRMYAIGMSLLACLALTATTVWAFPSLTDERSTCAEENCRSISVRGTYVHFQADNATKAIPAVYQVFSNGGECVRLEVIFQADDLDLEATLVCPSGTTWQDDDSAGNLRPLIKAITPSVSGWCTLQLASYNGDSPGGNRFVGERHFWFRYGRYPSNNPNCAAPTAPLIE
jgi:hypothetical protein